MSHVRVVLAVAGVGLLVYACATIAAGTAIPLLLVILGEGREGLVLLAYICSFILFRLGFFCMLGFVIGGKVPSAEIACAATGGLGLGVVLALLEGVTLTALYKLAGQTGARPGLPTATDLALVRGLAVLGLQVGVAALGGWFASRRRMA